MRTTSVVRELMVGRALMMAVCAPRVRAGFRVASLAMSPNASHRQHLRTRNPRAHIVEKAETDRAGKNGARWDDCAFAVSMALH